MSIYNGKKIVVWFSCGAASAVAAKIVSELYSDADIKIVNQPIREEHVDNRRFLRDIEKWIGIKIEESINPKWPGHSAVDVWERERYMNGIHGASCTRALKKNARYIWEDENKPDFHVLGFTIDEKARFFRFIKNERENTIPVLIDAGLNKQDCIDILLKNNILPPFIYSLGFPNANCIGCVKAASASYWNLVRKHFPDIFDKRAKLSRYLKVRLVKYKGKRLFLDELPEFIVSRPVKSMKIECGIFCEEKK